MSTAIESTGPGRGATIVQAATLTTLLAAAAAPTPLYGLYQQQWGFSPVVLTLVFAVYAFSLLAALLTVGSLSDHLGRRPLIVAALALQSVALALFLAADAVPTLLAARVVQGFANGIATTALGAALVDASPTRGPLVNSVAPLFGMAAGILGTSALVAFGPAPTRLVYLLLLAAMAVQAALVWRMPETAPLRPGAWASLRPVVRVPAQARGALLRVTPINVAVWGLGGFFLSLVPTLVRTVTGSTSPLVGGIVVSTLTLSGAASILWFRQAPARALLGRGPVALGLGVASLLAGVHAGEAVFLIGGTAVAGAGFGASFLGSLRTIMPLASPDERAGLLAAFYIESYLAFSVPAILLGALTHSLGLVAATDAYGALLLALVVVGAVAVRRAPARVPCPAA
ncbi:MFS transporter [Azospirillum sp. ST 5-10]|uniref:MFS transporter n=1 Tax=unclassified Azospirillum TaxID=2630922 RepID=UPI003F4A845A